MVRPSSGRGESTTGGGPTSTVMPPTSSSHLWREDDPGVPDYRLGGSMSGLPGAVGVLPPDSQLRMERLTSLSREGHAWKGSSCERDSRDPVRHLGQGSHCLPGVRRGGPRPPLGSTLGRLHRSAMRIYPPMPSTSSGSVANAGSSHSTVEELGRLTHRRATAFRCGNSGPKMRGRCSTRPDLMVQ